MDSIILPDDTPLKRCPKCPNPEENRWHPATPEYFASQRATKDKLYPWCRQCVHQDYIEHKEERKQREALRKEEISQYQKAYRAEHREEHIQYMRQYYVEHKEMFHQYKRQYNAEHHEEVLQKARQYRTKHWERILQYTHQYYMEHLEQIKQWQRQYDTEHWEERSQYQRQYRATHKEERYKQNKWYRQTEHGRLIRRALEHKRIVQKKNVDGSLTAQQIQDKLKAQHYQCYYASCGHAKFEKKDGKYIFHLEHTIPLSRTEANPRHDMNYVVLSCPSCNLKKHDRLPHEFFEGGRLF